MMADTWKISFGSPWRGYKTKGQRSAPLVKRGTLAASDDGTLELSARYDPPGSGWLALGAALITGVLIAVIAQATGFCAGPGWLLWFIIIILMRRRKVTLSLHDADDVVLDQVHGRLAFHIKFEGKPRWISFEVEENFGSAAQHVRTLMPTRSADGAIERAMSSASITLIVLMVLFVTLVVVSVAAVLIRSSIYRPMR